MTARKAIDLKRYNSRQQRKSLGQSVLRAPSSDTQVSGLAEVIGDSPTSEFAVLEIGP